MTAAQQAHRDQRATVDRLARAGLWCLPVYGLLLALGTLTHQPDPATQFEDYARYITTDRFLVSHLVASILGAGVGLVGVITALVFLLRTRSAGQALVGTALTTVGNVLLTAVFAAAAFAQPAIGRAFLAGDEGMRELDRDVYGTPLATTAAVGLLIFVAGAIVLGRAVTRSSPSLRWAGVTYAVALPVFAVAGFVLGPLQPVAAVVLTVAAAVIARRLPRVG
jgi:hypothetical protein